MNDSDRESIGGLAAAAADLNESVRNLQKKISINRRWTIALTGLFAIQAVVILALVVVIINVIDTSNRIQDSLHQNYVTAQEQKETRTKVLCPTETVLLRLLELPRAAGAPPLSEDQQKALVDAVAAFKSSYATLGCQ